MCAFAGIVPRASSRRESNSIAGSAPSLDAKVDLRVEVREVYAARAAATAILLDASRLKNQTPGSRPSRCTYVRTFTS